MPSRHRIQDFQSPTVRLSRLDPPVISELCPISGPWRLATVKFLGGVEVISRDLDNRQMLGLLTREIILLFTYSVASRPKS
jgi:hypothetical protein